MRNIQNTLASFFRDFFSIYRDGFRNMGKLGKKLWLILLIKLFIMFVILRIFFFNNFLNSKFDTDKEKGDYVLEKITEP